MIEVQLEDPISYFEGTEKWEESIDTLIENQVLLSYSLAEDRSRLWLVIQASGESELMNHLSKLDVVIHNAYDYHEIVFHDCSKRANRISLN